MSESATATVDWTCERCEVTVSFMPDVKSPKRPDSWTEENGVLYCLGCRRERAGEAGLDNVEEGAPASDREKGRSHARIEFEIRRDPERPNNQIAQACHTSIVAVRKARERMGLDVQVPGKRPD